MLIVHGASLTGLIFLVRHAPCPLQKLAIGTMLAAFLVYSGSDLAWILYEWRKGRAKEVADNLLQIGVMVYIFRLFADEQIRKAGGGGAWTCRPSRN